MPCAAPLFDPARHEPRVGAAWSEDDARAAVRRIVDAAVAEYAPGAGWTLHPRDDPDTPGQRAHALYHGAAGVVRALHHLHRRGAVDDPLARLDGVDAFVAALPARVLADLGDDRHGSASWLLGESGALRLRLLLRPDDAAAAARLRDVVRGNLHNPVHEPMWGNAGTLLAAVAMAEAGGDAAWRELVAEAVDALVDAAAVDGESGLWLWRQDLYGRAGLRLLGAGHGLAGNAFAVHRAAAFVPRRTVDAVMDRTLATLRATALRDGARWNWPPAARPDPARGPLVQDCHGAPGIVCRLAGAPRTPGWDELLDAAGELTWAAGPLTKGASICHGTSGSGLAMLKLWRRTGEPRWLDRARVLAMHAIAQVEAARAEHGVGRHSLWSGDLGAACFVWGCVVGDDAFPTLDEP